MKNTPNGETGVNAAQHVGMEHGNDPVIAPFFLNIPQLKIPTVHYLLTSILNVI